MKIYENNSADINYFLNCFRLLANQKNTLTKQCFNTENTKGKILLKYVLYILPFTITSLIKKRFYQKR